VGARVGRKKRKTWNATLEWFLDHQGALVAAGGLVIYVFLRHSYNRFYSSFGVSPEEVGFGYADLLVRSAVSTALSILVGALTILLAVPVIWIFYLAYLALISLAGLALIGPPSFAARVVWVRLRKTSHRLVAAISYLALIVYGLWNGWIPFWVFIFLLYGGILGMVGLGRFIEMLSDGRFPPKVILGATRKRPTLYLKYFGPKVFGGFRAVVRYVFSRTGLVVAVVLSTLVQWIWYFPREAQSRARDLADGRSVQPITIPPSSMGIPVRLAAVEVRAEPVVATWATKDEDPNEIPLRERLCLFLLGANEGAIVLYDSELDTTVRAPSSHVVLTSRTEGSCAPR
jgi:hypothetical protein